MDKNEKETENNEGVEFFEQENRSEMQTVNSGLNSKTGGISYTVLVIIYCIFTLVASAVTALIANSIMSKYGYTDFVGSSRSYSENGRFYLRQLSFGADNDCALRHFYNQAQQNKLCTDFPC